MKRTLKTLVLISLLASGSAAMAASSLPVSDGDFGAPLAPISTYAGAHRDSIGQQTGSAFPASAETSAHMASAGTYAAYHQGRVGNASSSAFPASAEDLAQFAPLDTFRDKWNTRPVLAARDTLAD